MTLAALALVFLTAGLPAPIAVPVGQAGGETMQEGTIVSIGAATLAMVDANGKQIQHHVADAVQVMVNGKLAKLADLKAGMRVRAMINSAGDVTVITTIDNVKRPARHDDATSQSLGPTTR